MQNHEKSSSHPADSPPLRTDLSSSLDEATLRSGLAPRQVPPASSGEAPVTLPLSPASPAEPLALSWSTSSASPLGRIRLVAWGLSGAGEVSSSESGALVSGPPLALAPPNPHRLEYKPKRHRPTKWDTVVNHVEHCDLERVLEMERLEVKETGKANEEATRSGE